MIAIVSICISDRYLSTSETHLLQVRPQIIRRPARGIPRVEIRTLRTRVHHPVDGRPAAEYTSRGHNGAPVRELWRVVSLPKDGRLAVFQQVLREQGWVDDLGHLVVVHALLDQEDG